MNKFLIAAALCAALAACNKDEAAPAADPAATPAVEATPAAADPAAMPAADGAAVDTSAANSGLPQECEDYLNRAKACFAKSGGAAGADAFQQSIDQAKGQWEAMPDKSGLVAACTSANEQFTQTVAMMKCE